MGLKWQANARLVVTAAAFSIETPYADDLPPPRGRLDSQWSLPASASLLDARVIRALDATLVKKSLTNVPRVKALLFADCKVAAFPGLSVNALLTHESGKTATSDGSVVLPRAWQLDTGLRYQTTLASKSTQWKHYVENLSNRSDWREASTTYWGAFICSHRHRAPCAPSRQLRQLIFRCLVSPAGLAMRLTSSRVTADGCHDADTNFAVNGALHAGRCPALHTAENPVTARHWPG